MGLPPNNPRRLLSVSFDGDYPIELPRQTALGKDIMQRTLGQCRPNRRQSS
jgi:hypothetical protein